VFEMSGQELMTSTYKDSGLRWY